MDLISQGIHPDSMELNALAPSLPSCPQKHPSPKSNL